MRLRHCPFDIRRNLAAEKVASFVAAVKAPELAADSPCLCRGSRGLRALLAGLSTDEFVVDGLRARGRCSRGPLALKCPLFAVGSHASLMEQACVIPLLLAALAPATGSDRFNGARSSQTPFFFFFFLLLPPFPFPFDFPCAAAPPPLLQHSAFVCPALRQFSQTCARRQSTVVHLPKL